MTRTQLRELLARHGVAPRLTLGQHFLVDPNVVDRVVRTARVEPGHHVLEVGPGTGNLTRALVRAGAEVTAIELDLRLQPILDQELAGLGVNLVWADAMDVDYEALIRPPGWKVVANLPYQIGTPLLLDWLRLVPAIDAFTVMVQREVAERLVAGPGSPAYGLPSVVVGLHATAELVFKVPPQVFYPAPKVESAVVRLLRKPASSKTEEAIRIATAGFGQRRKMLRGSLAGMFDQPSETISKTGIDPRQRAEDLGPADFLRLAEAL